MVTARRNQFKVSFQARFTMVVGKIVQRGLLGSARHRSRQADVHPRQLNDLRGLYLINRGVPVVELSILAIPQPPANLDIRSPQ
jgi:hypothetical protein